MGRYYLSSTVTVFTFRRVFHWKNGSKSHFWKSGSISFKQGVSDLPIITHHPFIVCVSVCLFVCLFVFDRQIHSNKFRWKIGEYWQRLKVSAVISINQAGANRIKNCTLRPIYKHILNFIIIFDFFVVLGKKWHALFVNKCLCYGDPWDSRLVCSRYPAAPTSTWVNRGKGNCVFMVLPLVTHLNAREL